MGTLYYPYINSNTPIPLPTIIATYDNFLGNSESQKVGPQQQQHLTHPLLRSKYVPFSSTTRAKVITNHKELNIHTKFIVYFW